MKRILDAVAAAVAAPGRPELTETVWLWILVAGGVAIVIAFTRLLGEYVTKAQSLQVTDSVAEGCTRSPSRSISPTTRTPPTTTRSIALRFWVSTEGWVDSLTWEHEAERQVVDDYRLALAQIEARLQALDTALKALADTPPYREAAGGLRCFRGIDTLTAITILAELHDVRRFPTARALMAYLGLVPGEHSSGETTRRGRITKTGNTLVRRVLTEAAWQYQHRPGIGKGLAQRRVGQPARVIAIADTAQPRLCGCFRRMALTRMPPPKIAVATARELAGFI